MAVAPPISARILLGWCRGDRGAQSERDQLVQDAMHRAAIAVVYFFQVQHPDPETTSVTERGRWAGPLKFSERAGSSHSGRISEWLTGDLGPLPGSGMNDDLTVQFGFSGDLATNPDGTPHDVRVAAVSGPGIDTVWNEDVSPVVNFVFAGNPTTSWENTPSGQEKDTYSDLTLGLTSGRIEADGTNDYFRFALSPIWAR
jgi:hypothetical protein